MNKYDCSNKICNLTNIESQNLRADDDQILFNNPSVLSAIARASASMCKLWNKTLTYKIGDVVSKNDIVFISLKDGNLQNDPTTDRAFWSYFINPYANDFGKIKAYALHDGFTLLKSYNIASLTESYFTVGTGNFPLFNFTFKTPFATPPSFITNYPEYTEGNTLLEARALQGFGYENSTTKSTICYTTQSTNVSTLTYRHVQWLDNPYTIKGCVIWYANDSIIPAS